MTNYKVYRLFVLAFCGLFIVAKTIVGAAGHSGTNLLDYGVFIFTISTVTIQTLLLKVNPHNKQLKTILRFTLMTLVCIGLTYCSYEIIDGIIIDGLSKSLNIMTLVLGLFIFSSAKLLVDLFQDRIQSP